MEGVPAGGGFLLRRSLAVALAALTLVPAASAASPVDGEVSFLSDAFLEGPARFGTASGALDLSAPLARGAPLVLAWESARGHVVSVNWTVAHDPGGGQHSYEDGFVKDAVRLEAATLVGLACEAGCQVLVLAEHGGAGRVGLAGDAQGAVRWLDEPRRYWAAWAQARDGAFLREFGGGTLLVGEAGTPLADARAEAEGRLGLFFENAALILRTQEGRHVRVDATLQRDPIASLPAGGRVEEVRSRFGYLQLEGARLTLAAAEDALLLAPRLHVDLPDGTLRAGRAEGRVTHDGQGVTLAGETLEVTGALALDLAVRRDPPLSGGLFARPVLEGDFEGEATRLRAGAVRADEPTTPDASTAGATLGLALVATLPWWLGRLVLSPLYSRIYRGSVLHNPNRARLHRQIGEDPGRTPAELARSLGLARIVVRHHLRMLEAHRLVACRPDGRRRRYFLSDAQAREDTTLQIFFRDGPRRRLTDALGASPTPLTQQQLAERTGFSPRLVSYHLGRLASVGIVERHGSRPSAYRLRTPTTPPESGEASG